MLYRYRLYALIALIALFVGLSSVAAQDDSADRAAGPFCRAERSGFTETSTLADVQAFLRELGDLPAAERFGVEEFGRSREGRPLIVVRVPHSGEIEDPLRVLILANIHGGEVCGKEAVQILMREWGRGEHGAIRAACELFVVPIYNVDGNEKIAASHRRNVNGPVGGLGERANADGLDLNRDLVKAVTPETRALLSLFQRVRPHAFLDLHTTNGAPHGFDLTYAPSLSPNTDGRLTDALVTDILPVVRDRMKRRHGYRVFDYGNFGRSEPIVYATFDHRPRFVSNYAGLRNCMSILSEAYAYEPFEVRVRVTRAFVLESLSVLSESAARVQALCAAAKADCVEGLATFGTDTVLVDGPEVELPTRAWDRMPLPDGGTRVMRRTEVVPRKALLQVRFDAKTHEPLPVGWVVLERPSGPIVETLLAHGVVVEPMEEGRSVSVQRFEPVSGE